MMQNTVRRYNVRVYDVIREIVMQYTVMHYNAIVLDPIRPIVIQYNVILRLVTQ